MSLPARRTPARIAGRPDPFRRLCRAARLSLLVSAALCATRLSGQPDPFALPPSFLTQAAFSCGDVTLNGGATVASTGAANDGHVVANGGITLHGNSTIRGDATAGPGKTVRTTGLSRVTGTKGNLAAVWPCSPVDLGPVAAAVASANDNARVPATSKGRSPLSASTPPDLTLNGNETLVLPAGTYWLRDVTVNGGSVVSLSGDVRILAAGSVTVNGTSSLNGAGLASALRLFTSGPAVTVNGGSALRGFVYASRPTAAVTIDGGGALTGGVWGGRLTMNGRAWLTRDVVASPPGDPLSLTVLESGEPLADGRLFNRPVVPVVETSGGTPPVSVSATIDGTAFTSGTPVSAQGEHVLVATATDSGSPPQQTSITRRFAIDTEPPALVVATPPPGALVRTSPVVLAGTATGATELSLYAVPVPIGPGGAFSFTVPLVEGTNPLVLVARDAAGNQATVTHPVVLDSLPPVLTLTSPATGACLAAGTALSVSGRLADAHPRPASAPEGPAISLALTLPSGATTTVGTTPDATGSFSASIPLPEGTDGSATLVVTATDALGHAARALATVRVDSVSPEIAITLDGGPFPGSGTGSAPPPGSTPAVLGRAVVPRVAVRDGAAAPPPATLTLNGTPLAAGAAVSAEGAHLLVATARDCAGHEASAHAAFVLDTTAPVLERTEPSDLALLRDPVTTFSGAASPDVVTARVAGRDATLTPGTASAAFAVADFPWREGENVVPIELVDRAGNRAAYTRRFTVKTTGPLVEILVGGAPLGRDRTFFSALTPEVRTNEPLDGPGAATLTATLDGSPWLPGTPISSAGAHTLVATVRDVAGREASASASFTIDATSGPAVSITAPADGANLPGPAVDVSGTVSAPHASGPTAVRVNGRAAAVTGTTWTLASLPLEPDAPNEIVAVAVDAVGRSATSAVQVLVRSAGPKVVLLSPADGARTNRRKVDVVGAVVGGARATADGLVRAGSLTSTIDATGAFRIVDVPLADGPNTLAVSAVDVHGRTGTASVTVVSDATPPSVSFSVGGQALVDGATFAGAVTVAVAVSDAGGPAPAPRILRNGAPVAAATGTTDVPIPGPGGWVVSVVALDAAGNETRATRSFVVDAGACALSDVRPADGASTPDGKVTLVGRSGRASRVLVRVPQAGGGFQEYLAAVADGTFAAGDVPLPAVGENALQLVCEAVGGPATAVHRIVRLGGEGPGVAFTSPAAGALVTTPRVPVSGTVGDPAADLFVNGVKVGAEARTGSAFSLPGVALAEGPNVLVARAVDRAGRAGEARLVVSRDGQPPRLTVTGPTAGTRFGRRGAAEPVVDVTGAVDLASEPNLLSVVASTPAGNVPAVVDPVTGAFRAERLPLGASDGPVKVRVVAIDGAGFAATVEVDVVVDLSGPALMPGAPPDLARLVASSPATVPVAGEAWAAEGASVSVNGIALDPATLDWEAPAPDGRRRVAFSSTVTAPAADGPFGLIVRVEDRAGRSASARRLLVRDTVAPRVLEVVPAAGATSVDPNVLVLALFSEELSRVTLAAPSGFVVRRDGQAEPIVGTFTVAGSAVAFAPGAALTPGATYRVSLGPGLTDVAGNPLAQPVDAAFVVAPALSGVAPVLDPAPPAVVCAPALALRGTAPAGATVRATDGDLGATATADGNGVFTISLPLVGNGFHDVAVRVVGRDGTSGPAARALVRRDCSAPVVDRAELDRAAGRLTVLFSETMDPAKLTLASAPGDDSSVLLTLETDPAASPRPASLALDPDGRTLRLELPQGPDAWWQREAVRLAVRPPAADVRGNVLAAPWVTTFFPGAGPGDLSGGFLSGEAYDDATGRPLDGVETRLFPSTAALPGQVPSPDPPSALGATDARGRYGFFGDVAAGRWALHLARTGYSPVVRRLALAPGSGAVPFDARLTPLAPPAGSRWNPSTGGRFEGPSGLVLEAAANAFSSGPDGSLGVRLTPLSAQALPELLPLGWSALAAADVRLETEGPDPVALTQAARFTAATVHLTLLLPPHAPAGGELVAVRHDLASGRWLTLGPLERLAGPGGADLVRVALASPGAVAVVLADTDPEVAPPALEPGEGRPLTASAAPSPAPAFVAKLVLDPPVVAPTGRATARVVARSADGAAKWPSGLAVQAYLDEKLVLSGGGELYEAPFAVDLLLAHHPVAPEEFGGAAPGTVGALSFAVSPSPKAAEVLVETGWENVRLYPFPESLERGSVLGVLGGTVSSPDGVELTLQEGALAESVAVEARLLSSAELAALAPPAGFDLLAAVRVSLSGRTLARAATLSVPLPPDAPEDPAAESRVLLAAIVPQPADGRGAFARLTARASRLAGPRALCAPEAAGSALPVEGLVAEGTYLVLRARAPLGFATGFVRIGSGNGLALARVTTPALGTADLSRPGGRYAIPVPAGDSRDVSALHPQLDETATARIAILAPSTVFPLDLLVRPVGPRVLSVQPEDRSSGQSIGSPLLVRFSEPIDPASVVPGLLTAELLAEDGSATGASFHGALVLQADGATLVFKPTHPLPPGRRIRGRLGPGVRDAGGTPYEGPLPYLWSFTTSAEVSAGGQIDPKKIRLLLPENGVARVVGAAGAVPTVLAGQTPWSVSASVENAAPSVACPVATTTVDTTGSFSVAAGCASTPVSLSSRVFLTVLDPAGNPTVLPLGPFVTADGLGFVPTPGRTTVYTTPEGVEVTVPAGAFDEAKVVRVVKKDPATLGVVLPAYLSLGAFVDVDFEGEASETLRLRVPVTTTSPVGTLVFAGAPIDLPWGRKLRLIDLARIVDGGGGTKVISNAEADQPAVVASASSGAGRLGALALPGSFLRTALLELTRRAAAAFFHGEGVTLAAAVGHVDPALLGVSTAVFYGATTDAVVYAPVPHDWDGHYVLPSVVGSSLEVVTRDVATGWILGQSAYDPAAGGGNGVRDLGELPRPRTAAVPRPPALVDASPFHVLRLIPPDGREGERCERLRLELEACTARGLVEVRPVPGTRLPEGSTLELTVRRKDGEGRVVGGQSGRAAVGPSGAMAPTLLVPAGPEDDVSLVVAPADLEPESPSLFRFDFDQPLEPIPDDQLDCDEGASTCAVELLDLGEESRPGAGRRLSSRAELSPGRTTLLVEVLGVLARGHAFELRLRAESLLVRNEPGRPPTSLPYPAWAPSRFLFTTRPAAGGEIGSVGPGGSAPSLGDTNVARDIVRLGNVLLAGSATGGLLAFDTSDITGQRGSPALFARAVLAADDIRSMATDGHGRVFFTARVGASWVVRALAVEEVRRAEESDCPAGGGPAWASGVRCFEPASGGAKVAFVPGGTSGLTASEYLGLTGGLPAGVPSDLEVLVTDETNPPDPERLGTGTDSPRDFGVRDFYARYGAGGQLPAPEPDGSYVLDLLLKSTHRRRPGVAERAATTVCPGEQAWDHFQRVTVDNLTTGQSFSFDIHNEWSGAESHDPWSGADGELTVGRSKGIRVRPEDRLRVRFNLRALGYVAVVGGGVSAVDLNRFYRTPSTEGARAGASQCGRLLAREEGATHPFPACPASGGAAPEGLLYTPSVGALPAGGAAAALFTPLLHFGPVRLVHDLAPTAVAPGPGAPALRIDEATCLRPPASAFPGLAVVLRDVSVGRDVAWIDRGGRFDASWQFRSSPSAPAAGEEVRSDLVFYSAGPAGVLAFALAGGPLGTSVPIGRFYRKDHPVSRVAVDPSGRFLLAGGQATVSPFEPFIDVWDVKRANGVPDAPGLDGADARLVASLTAPWDAGHVLFDESGTGLLYTWGNDATGGRAVPLEDPRFVFAGLYRSEDEPAPGQPVLPVSRVTTRFAPLGVPLRVAASDDADAGKRKEVDRVATPAFRVRVSLPGDLGSAGEILAKVQALRALPEARNLGRDDVGAAVGLPGGPGWPSNEVFVTLRRLGATHATSGADETGGSGRLSVLFNEYESREVVVLLADPRARRGYSRQQVNDPEGAEHDEESQCRRCDRPPHLKALVDEGRLAESDVKELLAAGPWVRVLLSTSPNDPSVALPEAARTATEKVLRYFDARDADGDVYRRPSGTAELFGWADEVPPPFQVALGEPALGRAELPLEAGGSLLLASGEAQVVATDHAVRGRGLGFAADRTWRSGLLGYGPFGAAGFTSPLLAHLREVPALPKPLDEADDPGATRLLYPGEVRYHDGEGRVFRFFPPCSAEPCPPGYVAPPVPSSPFDPPLTSTRCPSGYEADDNGSYCVPKGLYLRLEKRGAGWRLVSRNHETAEFDEKGRLVVLSDRHRKGSEDPGAQGNSLQLFYDTFSQIAALEDDFGRRYRLTYRDDPRPEGDGRRYGLVESLEDFARRTVEYEFHPENRTLTRVRLPEFTNPAYGRSYTGDRRPSIEYLYGATARGPGAPLNGPDFAKVVLTGFRAPREPERTDVPERLAFAYDAGTGRVVEASVPASGAGARPRWSLGWTPGSGNQPAFARVTQPWGHVVTHEVRNGRVTAIEEDAETLADSDPTPAADGAPPVRRLRTEIAYESDGRLSSTTRPDGSATVNEYSGASADRLSRANVTRIVEKAGTASRGRAEYSETSTRLDYSSGEQQDNLPSTVEDGRGRVARLGFAASASAGVLSGYDAAAKQPQTIRAKTDYDPFGRMKRFVGGPGLPTPLAGAVTYGKDARGREGAGFASEVAQGSIRETLEYDGGDARAWRGNVTRRTTSFGTSSTAAHDEWDRPVEETFGLSNSGRYRAVEDARTRRAFDAAGRLVSEIRRQTPLGDVETRTEYDDRDQVVSVVVTKLASDTPGASPQVEAETRYGYDAWGRLATVTSPQGVVTTRTWDSAGRLRSERTGDAGERRRAYDPVGRVALLTDGDQGVFRVRHDAWGRPWAEDHPTGARVERTFDEAGGLLVESTWDKADEATRSLLAETRTNVTSYGSVNEIDELLTAVPRTQRLTRKAHDEAGRLVRVTSGPSEAIQRNDLSVTYDGAGRPVEVSDAGGNRTLHAYDTEAPWPTRTERRESVPGLPDPVPTTTTRYERDALGRVVEELRGDGRTVRTTLDQAGNVLSTQLGLEAPTRSTYDGAGRPVAVERPAGRGFTSYGYDRDGRLLARVSAGHERVDRSGFRYEPATGRLARIDHPDGTSQAFTYNPDDTVDVWTMRSGIRLRNVYDSANRLLARQVTAAGPPGSPLVDGGDTFGWDPLSRLVSAERPSSSAPGVVYLGFDSAGRPREEVVGSRAPLSRTWDTWSREAEVVLPVGIGGDTAGFGYARSYDALDRLTGLSGLGVPALGAGFTWGGASRLYGQVTNGPLHVAHRYSFLGSGLGPQPDEVSPAPWRLGVLSVGAAARPTDATDAPSHVWGQLGYGYRAFSGLKVGRRVLSSASLVAGQGWAWGLDAATRLSWAEPGAGTLEETGPSSPSRFDVSYGAGDEVRVAARPETGEAAAHDVGVEGRIVSRDGVPFTYDAEGHRTSDDRYEYAWSYRGELVSVTVRECWPATPSDTTGAPSSACPAGQVRPLRAGERSTFVRDALGRVFAERRLGPPSVPGDDGSRPFLEEKELLWDGGTLLAEAGRAADGALLWRKSYVPGPSGLDDAVQLRVERYDVAGARTSDRLFSYVRDEQGSVLSVVEETAAADPSRPNVLVRYHYDPWGQAHAEVGPEVRSAAFEPGRPSVALAGGASATQSVDPAVAVGGAFRIVFSLAVDEATLPAGLVVERRLTDGSWGALAAADLALARDPSGPEAILALPLAGWQKGSTYRFRVTSALRDSLGRAPATAPTLEVPIPSDGSPVAFERRFPVSYETFLAAGETAGGAFPGGQPLLWQGAWTSAVGGHQLKRARVYDPRTASFLSEDPLDDIDSPNLYGYVAGRPHEATDPWGLVTDLDPRSNPDVAAALAEAQARATSAPMSRDWSIGPMPPASPAAGAFWYGFDALTMGNFSAEGNRYGFLAPSRSHAADDLQAFKRTNPKVVLGLDAAAAVAGPGKFLKAVGLVGALGSYAENTEGSEAAAPIAVAGTYRGGPHSNTRLPTGDEMDSHHMPPRSVSPLDPKEGPAIKMDPPDHKLTSSYGGTPEAQEYRAELKTLLAEGRWREAMAKEIRDVRRVAGKKYNQAVAEMLEYAKKLGVLAKKAPK